MASPTDRFYTRTHEWHQPMDGLVAIGISRFAVDELTDITFLDVRRKSGPIKAGESFGEIESVKATSELYAGIDGTVIEVNHAVLDNPGLINEDPYAHWLIKVQPRDAAQVQQLMSPADYDAQHA